MPLQPAQLKRWRKQVNEYKQAVNNTRKTTKVATNKGRPSSLQSIQDEMITWLTNMRANGVTVSVRMASIRAKKLMPSLQRAKKKRYSLFAVVRRFLRSNGFTVRTITHTAQEHPDVAKEKAKAFVVGTRPFFSQQNRHQAYILNMDQTPYNVKDAPSRTLAERGSRSVDGKTPKTSVGRISCFLTVCADGSKLPPLLVYKGKPGGSVEREFSQDDFPQEGIFCCVQENAWTDERVMLLWVKKVLKPYAEKAPEGIVPYLLLDSYKCHTTQPVVRAIEDLGVEWDIIPGGCTGLAQPIDVGIGKPFKNRCRYKWEEHMMFHGSDNGTETPLMAPKQV